MLNYLKNLGLSDKEAKVYLAMLELGPSPVLAIAARAGVNRPTAYVQIEALKEKGLTSTQTKGKKQLFIAESPEQLSSLLERENESLKQKKSELARALPDLKTMFDLSGEKPQVRYFEGKEGILNMQREVLRCKEKLIRSISSLDNVTDLFPNHLQSYTQERVQRGIRSRFIYTSAKGAVLKETDAVKLRESKFVPPEKLPLSFDFTVFDDTVKMEVLQGKISGVVVQNKKIADSFKSLFDFIWNFV